MCITSHITLMARSSVHEGSSSTSGLSRPSPFYFSVHTSLTMYCHPNTFHITWMSRWRSSGGWGYCEWMWGLFVGTEIPTYVFNKDICSIMNISIKWVHILNNTSLHMRLMFVCRSVRRTFDDCRFVVQHWMHTSSATRRYNIHFVLVQRKVASE
jgi:hypothetical protein